MCYVPLFVHDKRVSCGKCPECQRAIKSDWIYRCDQQARATRYNYFVTLTYNNDHLPATEELAFRDMFNFRKALNSYLGTFAFFYTLERGELHDRMHFHLLIYLDKPLSKDLIRHLWNRGFIKRNAVTMKSIRYTCSYMFLNDNLNKVRMYRASNGFGGVPSLPWRIRRLKNGTCERVPLPRYYTRKYPEAKAFAKQYYDNLYHDDDFDSCFERCKIRFGRLRSKYGKKRFVQSYEDYLVDFLKARVRVYPTFKDPRDLIAFPGPSHYRGLSRSYMQLLRRVDAILARNGDRRSGNLQRYLMIDCPMSLRDSHDKLAEFKIGPPKDKKYLVRPKIQLTFL